MFTCTWNFLPSWKVCLVVAVIVCLLSLNFCICYICYLYPPWDNKTALPQVTVGQNTYNKATGECIDIRCTVKSFPQHDDVYWERKIGSHPAEGIDTTTSKYSINTNKDTPNLKNNDVQESDEGYYTCFARNVVGLGQSTGVYKNVIEQTLSQVTVGQDTYTKATRKCIDIRCTVKSCPQHDDVYWERKIGSHPAEGIDTTTSKYSINTNKDTPNLRNNDIQESDEGYYTCFARNVVGLCQSTGVYKNVIEQTKGKEQESPTQTLPQVTVGQDTYTQATVKSFPQHDDVYWKRNIGSHPAEGIDTTASKYSLNTNKETPNLKNIEVQECFARNVVGLGQSTGVYVNVIVQSKLYWGISKGKEQKAPTQTIQQVTVRQDTYTQATGIDIRCTVKSFPQHEDVYWERKIANDPTEEIETSKSKYSINTNKDTPNLKINDVQESDEGYYTCFARNVVGLGQSIDVYLTVIGQTTGKEQETPTQTTGKEQETPTHNSTVGIFISVLGVGFNVVILVVVLWFIRRERRKMAAMEQKIAYLLKNKGRPSLKFESLKLLQKVKTVDHTDLENKYCVISFSSKLLNRYRAMIRSTVVEKAMDKNLTESYFLIQSERSVLDIPKDKVIFIWVDYNPSNVILETPGQEDDDIKLLTVQACRKMGADVFVIYIGDEGSRNLGVGLMYNTQLETVMEHFELKQLQLKNRVLTVSQDFSMSQDEAIASVIV